MTWGADKKPDVEPAAVVSSGNVADLAPGKSSPTSRQAPTAATTSSPTTATDAPLPHEARRDENFKLAMRIADIGDMYQRACDVVSLHRMMTPKTQPNFLVGLLFDVLMLRFSSLIVGDFTAVRTAALERAQSLELGIREFGGVKNKILALEPAVIASKLAIAVSKAKAAVVVSPNADSGTIAQAFIDQLKLGAAVGFTALRENLPGACTDAEAMTYTDAFAPERHPQPVYQALINDKIERYLNSGVAKIGRNADDSRHTPNSREDADPWAAVDVRVAWARYASGYPAQLVYQHASSRFDAVPTETTPTFGQGGGVNGGSGAAQRGGIGDQGWRRVPLEFADLALQRHMATWKTYPTTVDVDDMNWLDDPVRVQMAYRKRSLDARVPLGGANAGPMPHTVIAPKPDDAPIVVPDALKLKPAAGGAP